MSGGGSLGGGKQKSWSQSSSNVWGGQAPYLQDLYRNASTAAGGLANSSRTLGSQLVGGAMPAYQQLGQLAQVGNPFVQQQIGQLGQQMGQAFNDYVLPGINSTFALNGTLGGSNQGIAQGLAADRFGQAFSSGATGLLANSSAQAIDAAGAMGQFGGQIQNMNLMGSMGPYATLAAILGNPAILNQSQSKSKGWNIATSGYGGVGAGGGGGTT